MSGPTLSALVVAHNEEAQLADCLERLRFADEIVVVLDKCTDGSREIAARFTDRLLEGAWDIEGDRRNTGIEACTGDWIVEVDADERVPDALADEIRRVIGESRADWHELPVDNHVGGRLVRHGWGASFGRSAHAGLFRKGHKVWGKDRVHPRITLTGTKGARLANPIVHYVVRNISDMIRRLDSYSTARAADLRDIRRAGGDIGTMRRNVGRIFARFYKCYFRRKGYREAGYGFVIALCAGLYPILAYLKATLEDD